MALPTDVAYPDQVEAAASMVERRFGPIDVWVNNAMASVLSPAMKMMAEGINASRMSLSGICLWNLGGSAAHGARDAR
ncbi:MAG: hypothetical protein KF711_03935 [Nitrospira sp.]|nr:hypothetical protein [Nitrospira sp.]